MGLFSGIMNKMEPTTEKLKERVFVLSNQNGRIENPTKDDIKQYLNDLFNEEEQFVTLTLDKAINGIKFVKARYIGSDLTVQLGIEDKNKTNLVGKTLSTKKECIVVFYQFYDYGIVDNVETYESVQKNNSVTNFAEKEYTIFEMFHKQWALATAGNIDNFNTCTIGWGNLGTLWTRSQKGATVTIYVHPSRYTCDFLKDNDTFTVSFFDEKHKKELAYLGSRSGRNEDKVKNVGFTPVETHNSVTFKEAKFTFVCKKLYQHEISKENLAQEIIDYYVNKPQSFPLDENGDWHAHYLFIGEIIDVIEK